MKKKFGIEGMTCAACQARVQKAVEKLPGAEKVNVNLLLNSMTVDYDGGILDEGKIIDAVEAAGYRAYTDGYKPSAEKKRGGSGELIKLITCCILLLTVMYFSMGNMMWGWPAPAVFDHHKNPAGFALIQFILVLPILYIYRRYFFSGFKKLFSGGANMDSLIAVGAAFSVLYGIFALFMITYGEANLAVIAADSAATQAEIDKYTDIVMIYHDSLYFEAAGMILTLVSLGKYLEGLSKKRTADAIEKLMALAPDRAVVLKDGREVEIPSSEVKAGDIVIIKKGRSAPVDGVIAEGSGSFDQSNITGESVPVYKKEGEEVYSSSVLTAGYIKLRATKVGEDTSIAGIIKLVGEAANSKAPISRLADRISGIFVPVIFSVSAVTFIVNLLIGLLYKSLAAGEAVELALRFAVSVIVIACPCALGLATPVAVMVGTGKGAENGLLIRDAEILEKAHSIKTVVLDKTGTVTEGKPSVTDFIIPDGQSASGNLLSVAASLESMSEHPLAQAITAYSEKNGAEILPVEDFYQADGMGLSGSINGEKYRIGNIKLAEEVGAVTEEIRSCAEKFSSEGKTPLILLRGSEAAAVFAVKDEVRSSSAEAVAALKKKGIRVVMLTGDNKKTAEAIAAEVGVDEVISEVLPGEKQKVIQSLKDGKNLVAMIGDGVNDAPALTAADVGIAIGGGSDVAVEAGDIVLLRKNLLDAVSAIDLSKRTLNTIKIGLFWAFFYNFICVIIATGALYYPFNISINPMIGSAAMSISSVTVVLNALTINLFKPRQSALNGYIKLRIKGMMCAHCEERVKAACIKGGAEDARADYKKKAAFVKGGNIGEIKKNISEAGYRVL